MVVNILLLSAFLQHLKRHRNSTVKYDLIDMAEHLSVHPSAAKTQKPSFPCGVCKTELRSAEARVDQLRRSHPGINGAVYMCKKCGKTFQSYQARDGHMRTTGHTTFQTVRIGSTIGDAWTKTG